MEVVTDKVTMEVPSPVEGELLQVFAAEGETLPMGTPIAEVGDPGESPSTEPPTGAPAADATPTLPPPVPAGTTGYLLRDVTPVGPTGGAAVEAMEPTQGGDAPPPPPSPPPSVAVVPPPVQTTSAPAVSPTDDTRPRLSPAVRRLAREHSVDLTRVSGSGMGGRITRDDVLRYLAEPQATPAAPAGEAPAASSSCTSPGGC